MGIVTVKRYVAIFANMLYDPLSGFWKCRQIKVSLLNELTIHCVCMFRVLHVHVCTMLVCMYACTYEHPVTCMCTCMYYVCHM